MSENSGRLLKIASSHQAVQSLAARRRGEAVSTAHLQDMVPDNHCGQTASGNGGKTGANGQTNRSGEPLAGNTTEHPMHRAEAAKSSPVITLIIALMSTLR